MENYIKIYEKSNRKRNFVSSIIAFVGAVFCFITFIAIALYDLSVFYILIPAIIFELWFINYRKKAFVKNINTINSLVYEDLEMELVLGIYEKLLSRKRRSDYSLLLVCYLQMLLLAGKFDQFIEVCYINKRKFSALHMGRDLTALRELLYSFEKDRGDYRKILQNQIRLLERLKKRNKNQEWILKIYHAKLQYELKEYEKVLEILDTLETSEKYNQLIIESYRQRCFYHLGKEYKEPTEMSYPFVAVLRWKTLVENGEEYFSSKSKEMIRLIEQGISSSKRSLIISCIVLTICSFAIVIQQSKKDDADDYVITEKVIETYKSNLNIWDYEALEVHGMIKNDDITSAVILATRLEKEPDVTYEPIYYIATIDHYFEGLIPMMRLNLQIIGYTGITNVFTSEGENSTYVVVIAGDASQIRYNGEIVEDVIVEKLEKVIFTNESYIHCFIHDGKFDKSLLQIGGEVDYEF